MVLSLAFRTSAVKEGRLRPLRPTIIANYYGRPLPSTFPAGAAAAAYPSRIT
ncbi:uncharacterized protein CLUP02_14851 [Colletotrichum lupini]|uniref:Uncharacterized protein n=1 Tax=Colletotrichum lupini TaxID=145971 RepID=A0A9Q8T549_9PEZI|nr:uncharacterized protein CLUP02_14851 [Colletotrichum lupini]UQC89322.1 hypothetical protein CLUP02_14851 [Colletotrichum lupini]